MQLESGIGNGFLAGVDRDNRLLTESVTVTQMANASDDSRAFLVATDFITLTTTASFSGVLYIKNTSTDTDMYIQSIRTCGDSAQYWRMYRNVTTGTLITGGTSAEIHNGKFGSNFLPAADVIKGADSLTITDGDVLGTHYQGAGHSVQDFDGGIELSPGSSIAWEVKPGTNPTDVCMQVLLFLGKRS